MKALEIFIKEALEEDIVIRHLIVKYKCGEKDDLYIQVPEKYSESDIQIYLDDTLLKDLPAEACAEELGKNHKEITDCYFEYDIIEPTTSSAQKADIPWDTNYDSSLNDTALTIMHIKNLKYVIQFDHFYLSDIDDKDKVKDNIEDLFKGLGKDCEENIPFKIDIISEDIEFKD